MDCHIHYYQRHICGQIYLFPQHRFGKCVFRNIYIKFNRFNNKFRANAFFQHVLKYNPFLKYGNDWYYMQGLFRRNVYFQQGLFLHSVCFLQAQ